MKTGGEFDSPRARTGEIRQPDAMERSLEHAYRAET